MLKQLTIFALTIALLFSHAKFTQAQYTVDEEHNEILVEKSIKGLSQGEWHDNLGGNEMIFKPSDQFEFRIQVKNTGNRNLTWIQVKDYLPTSLDVVFGRGAYDAGTHLMAWKIAEIKPGEQQETVIRVQVKGNVPKAITQWTNKVTVKAESGHYDEDHSVFYTNEGTGTPSTTTKLPATGTELVFGSLGAISLIAVALRARKFARGW